MNIIRAGMVLGLAAMSFCAAAANAETASLSPTPTEYYVDFTSEEERGTWSFHQVLPYLETSTGLLSSFGRVSPFFPAGESYQAKLTALSQHVSSRVPERWESPNGLGIMNRYNPEDFLSFYDTITDWGYDTIRNWGYDVIPFAFLESPSLPHGGDYIQQFEWELFATGEAGFQPGDVPITRLRVNAGSYARADLIVLPSVDQENEYVVYETLPIGAQPSRFTSYSMIDEKVDQADGSLQLSFDMMNVDDSAGGKAGVATNLKSVRMQYFARDAFLNRFDRQNPIFAEDFTAGPLSEHSFFPLASGSASWVLKNLSGEMEAANFKPDQLVFGAIVGNSFNADSSTLLYTYDAEYLAQVQRTTSSKGFGLKGFNLGLNNLSSDRYVRKIDRDLDPTIPSIFENSDDIKNVGFGFWDLNFNGRKDFFLVGGKTYLLEAKVSYQGPTPQPGEALPTMRIRVALDPQDPPCPPATSCPPIPKHNWTAETDFVFSASGSNGDAHFPKADGTVYQLIFTVPAALQSRVGNPVDLTGRELPFYVAFDMLGGTDHNELDAEFFLESLSLYNASVLQDADVGRTANIAPSNLSEHQKLRPVFQFGRLSEGEEEQFAISHYVIELMDGTQLIAEERVGRGQFWSTTLQHHLTHTLEVEKTYNWTVVAVDAFGTRVGRSSTTSFATERVSTIANPVVYTDHVTGITDSKWDATFAPFLNPYFHIRVGDAADIESPAGIRKITWFIRNAAVGPGQNQSHVYFATLREAETEPLSPGIHTIRLSDFDQPIALINLAPLADYRIVASCDVVPQNLSSKLLMEESISPIRSESMIVPDLWKPAEENILTGSIASGAITLTQDVNPGRGGFVYRHSLNRSSPGPIITSDPASLYRLRFTLSADGTSDETVPSLQLGALAGKDADALPGAAAEETFVKVMAGLHGSTPALLRTPPGNSSTQTKEFDLFVSTQNGGASEVLPYFLADSSSSGSSTGATVRLDNLQVSMLPSEELNWMRTAEWKFQASPYGAGWWVADNGGEPGPRHLIENGEIVYTQWYRWYDPTEAIPGTLRPLYRGAIVSEGDGYASAYYASGLGTLPEILAQSGFILPNYYPQIPWTPNALRLVRNNSTESAGWYLKNALRRPTSDEEYRKLGREIPGNSLDMRNRLLRIRCAVRSSGSGDNIPAFRLQASADGMSYDFVVRTLYDARGNVFARREYCTSGLLLPSSS